MQVIDHFRELLQTLSDTVSVTVMLMGVCVGGEGGDGVVVMLKNALHVCSFIYKAKNALSVCSFIQKALHQKMVSVLYLSFCLEMLFSQWIGAKCIISTHPSSLADSIFLKFPTFVVHESCFFFTMSFSYRSV